MLIKSKKGSVPETILVIGIIAICIFAIFSFVISSRKIQKNFVGIGLLETMLSIEEEIRLDSKVQLGKFSEPVIMGSDKIRIIADENQIKGNYTVREKGLFKKKEKTLIWIEYELSD